MKMRETYKQEKERRTREARNLFEAHKWEHKPIAFKASIGSAIVAATWYIAGYFWGYLSDPFAQVMLLFVIILIWLGEIAKTIDRPKK
jgi:hypothetical protein